MNRLAIAAVIALAAILLWKHQHARRQASLLEQKVKTQEAVELSKRAKRAEAEHEAAQACLATLHRQIDEAASAKPAHHAPPPAVARVAEPDPQRQGGWPQGAEFLYLPKDQLTNVQCRLLEGSRLTEEAATLLGMSGTEREAVNELFSRLFGQFRQLEFVQMAPVDPAAQWPGLFKEDSKSFMKFDSGLAYRIPNLATNMAIARQAFAGQLPQVVGPSRAQFIEQATDRHLRRYFDDFGGGERIIGFFWQPETDGTRSLWYGVAGDQHGPGTFNPVKHVLDPKYPGNPYAEQVNYYATLFGVQLPPVP